MSIADSDISKARSVDLLSLLPGDVECHRRANTRGGEWKGPCPFCGGKDRFRVQPNWKGGHFACRQCEVTGDAISFVRQLHGLSFGDAVRYLNGGTVSGIRIVPRPVMTGKVKEPQPQQDKTLWLKRTEAFVEESTKCLWGPTGKAGLTYLRERKLSDDTIRRWKLGFNPKWRTYSEKAWGLGEGEFKVGPGIVVPCFRDGHFAYVRIRKFKDGKPVSSEEKDKNLFLTMPDELKPPGLYILGQEIATRPCVMVEGQLDALTIWQEAGELVNIVAIGSTEGCRDAISLTTLAQPPLLLVALDADDEKPERPGEEAARWWLDRLPNAKRRKAWWGDANSMLQDGASVRLWVELGVRQWRELGVESVQHDQLPKRLFSKLFGEEILLAPDGADLRPSEDAVVYAHSEIPLLKQVPNESLSLIHHSKRLFPGSLVLNVRDSNEVTRHASSISS